MVTVVSIEAPDCGRLAAAAEVLAGGERQLSAHQAGSAERVPIGEMQSALRRIRQADEGGKRVVVLASGDPLLYGIGTTLIRELGRDRVRVIPGVSSVQRAFAAAGEPWHDAAILSAHGRPLAEVIPAALAAKSMAILTDGEATPAAISQALLSAGMEDCRAVVCVRLGFDGERCTEARLAHLPGQVFDALNVLLLFRDGVRLDFGRPDGEFESVRGQITKAEVRAVTLSKLRPPRYGVLWDIGAGSGALAIEAALLMPRGQVYAIERDAEQLACLRRNVARHGAGNVRIVAGEAPEALAGLPAPQAVFVGGTGGRLLDVLAAVPRPFVANLAVMEHLGPVLERFPAADVTQLNVARSKPVGAGRRLAALNPVYIVCVP